jgi:hypothetical protein
MPNIRDYPANFVKGEGLTKKYWIIIFVVYLVLLAAVVSRHEPWMDEAQAWLLAKDATLSEIFLTYLRYEGSPGLWHLILSIPAKANLPYFSLNVLSAMFSALAVWLFLRYSPFPPLVKILFPFSYFILFQYAVVARNYCLAAPLLFLIAIKFKTKIEKPFVFSFFLCLLANVSAHAFLIAGAIYAVHLLDVAKIWKELDQGTKIKQLIAAAMFGANSLLIVLTLLPAADHFLGNANNWSFWNFLNVSKWAISSALLYDESSRLGSLRIWLSLTVFLITVIWLRQKKLTLFYLFPLGLILMLFAVRYWNLWHVGILFFLWIFALWIGFDRDETRTSKPIFSAQTMSVVLACVLALQICWSFYAAGNDFFRSFSAAPEVAAYLKANDAENLKVFASGWKTVAIQPYFDKNVFDNFNEGSDKRFWIWTLSNQTPLGASSEVIDSIQKEQPDILVFASDHLDITAIKEIEGYRFEGVFEGYLYWKTGFHELNFYWVFRKN